MNNGGTPPLLFVMPLQRLAGSRFSRLHLTANHTKCGPYGQFYWNTASLVGGGSLAARFTTPRDFEAELVVGQMVGGRQAGYMRGAKNGGYNGMTPVVVKGHTRGSMHE